MSERTDLIISIYDLFENVLKVIQNFEWAILDAYLLQSRMIFNHPKNNLPTSDERC